MFFCLGFLFFFCGLEINKKSFENLNGRYIKKIITLFTDNIIFCIIIGIFFTAIIQSSSAVSIILISLLEAKLIKLKSALGIIMGANIGTTFTVQIMSLPILSAYYYLFIAGTFFIILGIIYNKHFFELGFIIISFGLIFWGLNLMTSYFATNNIKSLFINILLLSDNFLYGIFLGGLITAIVQSSSLVTGIVLSLARTNIITLPIAISISLGSNIGTCITAFLASIHTGKEAKTLAIGHFLFNLIGLLLLFLYYPLFLKLINLIGGTLTRKIANTHTLFNFINLLIFLPFIDNYISFLSTDNDYKTKY